MCSGREISENTANTRLQEVLDGSEYKKDFEAEVTELRKKMPRTLEADRKNFLNRYRGFHAQLREGDRLDFEMEKRETLPRINMVLTTSGGIRKEIGPMLLPSGLSGGPSSVLYDYL